MNASDHKPQLTTGSRTKPRNKGKRPASNHQNYKPECSGLPLPYDRAAVLVNLIPLYAREIAIHSREDHVRLLNRLLEALRAERRRGLTGHWTYSLTRHANLKTAYLEELELFNKEFSTTAVGVQPANRHTADSSKPGPN